MPTANFVLAMREIREQDNHLIGEALGGKRPVSQYRRLCYGAREASFKAKASEGSPTDIGGRRGIFGDGRRHISNCSDSERTVARQRTASRNYARRGGNF